MTAAAVFALQGSASAGAHGGISIGIGIGVPGFFCGTHLYGSASGLRLAAYLLSSPLCRLWAITSVRTSRLPRAPPSSLLLLLLTP